MPRISVLAVLVVAFLATTVVPAHGQALPDVRVSAPYDVQVVQREGRSFLGFAAEALNVGAGALRIQATGDGSGVMTARQLSDDGAQVLNPSVGTLRYVTTPTHQHWHYMDFMRYELRGIDHPSLLRDQKQGFCLQDAPFVSGWCARNEPGLRATELGMRPGGRDFYAANIEGQEIAIDPAAAPPGRYLLSARIGPTGVLRETRTDNNVASTVIRLSWPAGGPQPEPRPVPRIESCVGRRCRTSLPARSAAVARVLARKALRRALGRRNARGARVTCRVERRRAHKCRLRVRRGQLSFRGSVRVWYLIAPSVSRWYYTVDVVRTDRGCGDPCTRRIRRTKRPGGKVAASSSSPISASATSVLCRL